MNESGGIESRYQTSKALLQRRGQGHVLRWWDELDQAKREALLADIEAVPWEVLDPADSGVGAQSEGARAVPHDLAPLEGVPARAASRVRWTSTLTASPRGGR